MLHVCLTMHPNGNLLVYTNCGRPTEEEAKIIKWPTSLHAELRKLKKRMGYAKETKIIGFKGRFLLRLHGNFERTLIAVDSVRDQFRTTLPPNLEYYPANGMNT